MAGKQHYDVDLVAHTWIKSKRERIEVAQIPSDPPEGDTCEPMMRWRVGNDR